MRFWDDKDGAGNKLTDGRICLVIKSESDPDLPEQRIYGKDKDEIIDKAATTIATGQSTIHRLRKAPAAPVPARPATPATPTSQAADRVTAVADLSNPQKAGKAVIELLRTEGVDLPAQQRERALRNVGAICEKWQNDHPEYPVDPRNERIIMNLAANRAGAYHLITAVHLDAALEEAQREEMLHEPKPNSVVTPAVTVQPRGSEDSRTGRDATSYRRNSLRSPEPAAATPRESATHQRWRTIMEKGNGEEQAKAIRNEPGYMEWVDRQLQKTA